MEWFSKDRIKLLGLKPDQRHGKLDTERPETEP
jgi:hypothetical protein